MYLMTSLDVTFEIPEEIIKGLTTGSYERVGGVIRETNSKRTVAWLIEATSEFSEQTENIPAAPELQKIIFNQNMIMGLQVVNLGVSVAGFALLYKKLQVLESEIRNIATDLKEVKRSVERLDKKQYLQQIAPMLSALKAVNESRKLSNISIKAQKLTLADNQLCESVEYFWQILQWMLVERLETEYPAEFAACYRAWNLACQGSINSMLALEEVAVALDRLNSYKSSHAELGLQYKEIRGDKNRRILSIDKASPSDPVLTSLGAQMIVAHDLIKGQALQIEFIKENNFQITDIEKIPAGEMGVVLL